MINRRQANRVGGPKSEFRNSTKQAEIFKEILTNIVKHSEASEGLGRAAVYPNR